MRGKKLGIIILGGVILGSSVFVAIDMGRSKEVIQEKESEKDIVVERKEYSDKSFEIRTGDYVGMLLDEYLEREYGGEIISLIKIKDKLKVKEKEIYLSIIAEVRSNDAKIMKELFNTNKLGADGNVYVEKVLRVEELSKEKIKLSEVLEIDEASKRLGKDIITLESAPKELYQIKQEAYDVKITTDGWITSIEAPVKAADFASETRDLEKGSYYISKEEILFICKEGEVLISRDRGETYEKTIIPKEVKGEMEAETRRQFIGKMKDGNYYAVITGGRVVREEGAIVYVSKDGGKSFKKIGSFTSSLINDISIIDEKNWYVETNHGVEVTKDGGKTFNTLEIPCKDKIPEFYDTLTIPIFQGDYGIMYITGGEDADGLGQKQRVKLETKDGGKTWIYKGEVFVL